MFYNFINIVCRHCVYSMVEPFVNYWAV